MQFDQIFFFVLFLLIAGGFVINLFLSRRKIPIGRISALLLIAWMGIHVAFNFAQSVGLSDSIDESDYTSVRYRNLLFDNQTLDLSKNWTFENGSCLVVNSAISKATIILPKNVNVSLSTSSLIGPICLPNGEHLLLGQSQTQVGTTTDKAPTLTIIADNILGAIDFVFV